MAFPRFAPHSVLLALALVCQTSVLQRAQAYVFEGRSWPTGSVVSFQMGLGSPGRTLLDGNTSWDAAAAPAAQAWNNVVAGLHLSVTQGTNPPVASGDGVNAIVFASSVFGQSFGSNTLAVTYYRSSGANMIEADVLFNRAQVFDSYRGPLRFGTNGLALGDIRRVLTHELGHALGLDHPDQHAQTVDAIMNSVTSDRETLANDDVAGAQAMYGAAASVPAPTPVPTPAPPPGPTPVPSGLPHFANISSRMNVGTGGDVAIAGFIVSGSQSKTVLIRALGPTLGSLGLRNVVPDPLLELHDGSGALIISNDDWQTSSQSSRIASSGYAPTNGLEPAIMTTLRPGAYTVIVKGYNDATGTALLEVYDMDSSSTRLANMSTRAAVGTGDNVLIAGLIVSGNSATRAVVRALGPTLGSPPYSVPGAMRDPVLELHDSSGNVLASNDDWITGAQAASLNSTGYAPPDPAEPAVMATLSPGKYTAIVYGKDYSTGIALVEAYDLDE